MKNLVTDSADVNPTPENACIWIESKIKSHELNGNTGRMWAGAIRALAGMLREDEPTTLSYFKDSIGELARRWVLANQEKGSATGGTYAARARTGVATYERFLANPSGFRFDSRASSPSTPRKRRAEPEVKDTPAPATANDSRADLASIPLPGKEPFRFEPPKDMKQADVMRIAWGLLVYCTDFDPNNMPVPPPGTSMVPAA